MSATTPPAARSEGVQYAAGEKLKEITYSSRKNEVAGPKWKQHSVLDVSTSKRVRVQRWDKQTISGTTHGFCREYLPTR